MYAAQLPSCWRLSEALRRSTHAHVPDGCMEHQKNSCSHRALSIPGHRVQGSKIVGCSAILSCAWRCPGSSDGFGQLRVYFPREPVWATARQWCRWHGDGMRPEQFQPRINHVVESGKHKSPFLVFKELDEGQAEVTKKARRVDDLS